MNRTSFTSGLKTSYAYRTYFCYIGGMMRKIGEVNLKSILKKIILCFFAFSCFIVPATAKEISIVYNIGIAPIKFTDSQGQPSGILIEYWKLLAQKSGLQIRFVEVETFGQSLEMVKNGEVDFHAGLYYTEERSKYLKYSRPVFDLKYYIYTIPQITPIETLAQTSGFILGVVQGGYTENFIKKVIPSSRLAIYKTYEELYDSVLKGEVKTFVSSDIHLNYYLSKNGLDNPFKPSKQILFEQTYYGASNKENKKLFKQVIQGQEKITETDTQILKNRWLHYKVKNAVSSKLEELTLKEKNWIKKHRVLKVTNEMDWPPFDFNTNEKPKGFSIDLLNLIAERVGIQLEYVYGYTWNELLGMIKDKKLDIVHSLNKSKSREKFILFTSPYVSNQTVIVTSKDNKTIKESSDLNNKSIAVIAGYNQKDVLKNKFSNIKFVSVSSPLESLKAVSSGRADATIRFNGVANFLMHQHLLTNLKFVDEFKMADDNLHELFFGVRSDYPILQKILQKGLDSVTMEEMNELKRKWINFDTEPAVKGSIDLTEKEKLWIKNNPEIRIGADYKWPPFDFEDADGHHAGLASSYMKLIAERTGLKVKIETGVWANIIEKMKKGQLEGLACAVKTNERTSYLNFSKPYLSVPTVIVTKEKNRDIHSMKDLYGKSVSINSGSYMHDRMKKKYPQINLHLTTSNEASIEAVSYGEADAYIGNLAVSEYIIREKLLTNLKVVKRLDHMTTETSVAVDKKLPILMGIMQKALDSISTSERKKIQDEWYLASTEQKVALTERERRWLDQHPVIKYSGDPQWAPISYFNEEGIYSGMIPDYFKLIEAKSGLRFKMVKKETWEDVLQAFQKGEIDVLDAITENTDRKKIMNFTNHYVKMDVVLVTRDEIKFIKGLEHIGDKKLGVIQEYVTESYIRRDFPEQDLFLYANAAVGLKALAKGDIDVFAIDIPTFEFYAKQSSLTNLKISGLTPYAFKLAIGVNKGQPELLSILNKTLGLISQREKNEIYNNWVTFDEPLVDYSLIWKLGILAVIIILITIYWNLRLSREVALRKIAEEKAISASRAKSDFLANMSHEIRTPMNSVLGFAELLDHMILDPEQKSYLKSIRLGGNALLGIINDILDLSKIEAGKISITPEPVSLKKVFEEMKDSFENRITQKNLAFEVRIPETFPEYILLDSIRLRQILVNLIGNALKFTEYGSIQLTCQDVDVNKEGLKVSFYLSVIDTGLGIAEDEQKTIFNKFEQQTGQDNAKYGGTGLGLSICESLARLMGIDITLQSTLGEGSSFLLKLTDIPIVKGYKEIEDEENFTAIQFAPVNILVVDDVKDNRTLVKGYLKDSGATILEAENGKEALEVLKQNTASLVFMDLRMPEMSGYEAISEIKNNLDMQRLPVIAFTASVMGEDLKKVKQYGFDGYLRKPVSRSEIYSMATRFLSYRKVAEVQSNTLNAGLDLLNLSKSELEEFIDLVDPDLLAEWKDVKDKGDFEMIHQFATRLKDAAVKCGIDSIIHYSDRLQEQIKSFDIIEVDQLMKQFPEQIQYLKDQVAEME